MPVHSPYQLFLAKTEQQQEKLKQFIQTEYTKEFNAIIPLFLPLLLGLQQADGKLVGACGLQHANTGELYLEHYLNGSIEEAMEQQLGITTQRYRIIEIGNFACTKSGSARIMFAALCRLLVENNLDYVAFTGTKKLRNVFHRLHLAPKEIALASAESMSAEEAATWGSYYLSHPYVMIVDLQASMEILSKNSLLFTLIDTLPDLLSSELKVAS